MMGAKLEKGERLDLPMGTVVNIHKLVNMPGSVYNGEKQEKYNVVIPAFVARNQNGTLFLHITESKFERRRSCSTGMGWWDSCDDKSIELDASLFPDVDWEDDYPTEVQLRIM